MSKGNAPLQFGTWVIEICLELGILDLGFRAWPMALKKFECET
jgi:hypothetical protein